MQTLLATTVETCAQMALRFVRVVGVFPTPL
jgi:hypothetical protein